MSEQPAGSPTKDRVAAHLYFLSLYFVVVGVLYLWGYWGTFGVNILEYLSFTDVLKVTLYPVVSTLVVFVFGALIGELQFGPILKSVVREQEANPRKMPFADFIRRHAGILRFLYLVLLAFVFLKSRSDARFTMVLAAIAGTPIYGWLKSHGLFESILPSDSARSVTIYALVFIPFYAYMSGAMRAEAVRTSYDYWYVAPETPQPGSDSTKRVKHLGYVNGYIFLLHPDNSTLSIVPFDKSDGLKVRHFKQVDVSK